MGGVVENKDDGVNVVAACCKEPSADEEGKLGDESAVSGGVG